MNDMNCEVLKTNLPDLLLDASYSGTDEGRAAQAHLAGCAGCRDELRELRATMQLMDMWQAPEPSAYFDTKMQVRLRQEFAAPPASLWQRVFGRVTAMSLKPVMAGVMAIAVVIGGVTYAGVAFFEQPQPHAQESATLRDLQSLDRNQQTFDDLNSLDQQLGEQNTQQSDPNSNSDVE